MDLHSDNTRKEKVRIGGTMILHEFQEKLISDVRQAMRHTRGVLLQSATGSGKSVMASAMIAAAREKKSRAIFTVPRRELLKQMDNTFNDFQIPHSFAAAGKTYNKFAHTHIAMLGTIQKRIEELNPSVVFIDECHYGGVTLNSLIKWLKEKRIFYIGLSATPARLDNFGMGDWFDHMVQGPSIRCLIDNKFLSEYALVQPSVKLGKGQIGGNPVDEWARHSGGRLTVAYCRDKKHGKITVDQFTAAGVPAAFMESNTPADERRRIIEQFADGKIKVIVNCQLLQMGFDLASQIQRKINVRCMLDLQPTQSLTAQMQKNGRALRYDPDGHAVIIDLAGNSYEHNHGYPCADRNWTLETVDQHKKDVEFRERNISLMTCKACYRPARIGPMHCPYCGVMYDTTGKKVKEVDGKLVVITPEMLKADKVAADNESMGKRQEVGRARTIEDLQRIATERGYARGWVFKQAQIKGIYK